MMERQRLKNPTPHRRALRAAFLWYRANPAGSTHG